MIAPELLLIFVVLSVVLLFLLWQGAMYLIALFQRSAIERIVIGQIGTVLRQNLPLATALSLAGDSERGMARVHLKRISRFLSQGASLPEAMRLGYPECSRLVLSLTEAGERAGRLPAAIEQAEEYLVRKARWRRLFDVPVGLYVAIVMSFACFMVSGIMVAVVPKFKAIFQDFGTRLPGLTLALIDISAWFVQGTPPGWVLVVLIPFIWLAMRVWYVDGRPLTARISESVRATLPGVRRMEFGHCMSEMLRLMRTAIASGMDLGSAARLAASLDVNRHVRDRMRCFADLLDAGEGSVEACRTAGLGPVLAVALAAGARSGDMDAALRYAADYHEAIVTRWWITMHSLVWPLCTIAMGAILGFIAVALFLPLVQLINSVTYWAPGASTVTEWGSTSAGGIL
jgi:type IV pilus assembly protein PilC